MGNLNNGIANAIGGNFIGNAMHSMRRKILFENRNDALQKLLHNMPLSFFEKQDCVVVGISFAGVFFAHRLAEAIKAPLAFLFTSPITAPNNSECEIAMATETHDVVINDPLVRSFGISLDYIYGEVQRQYEDKMLPLIYQYRKGNPLISLKDKRVLLVDEGIDSGLTALASIKSVITLQAKTVHFACPVAPIDVAEVMDEATDGIFCLYRSKNFVDIGYYYKDYPAIESSVIEEIFNNIRP
ncbi:phosphoribosyltransferase family protein [Helicobacter sp. MIT 05-5294]|uniref:phosphoribosyltransferase n=1 Tax=Helicobacter sp. MIT 05-5294 TaxID=1548150 RepID=UPI000A8005EC|nr:phosphoribosyltransferase family protein [Helicobacter sp. MIT 05-5294]